MVFFTHWGSSAEERAHCYPCDLQLPSATAALYRAVDIAAPPSLVYRFAPVLRPGGRGHLPTVFNGVMGVSAWSAAITSRSG